MKSRYLRRLDPVARAYLGRPDPRQLAHAPDRLEYRDPVS